MVVLVGKIYLGVTLVILVVYTIRHYLFTLNRMFRPSRQASQDLYDSEPPMVTVLIPMHNEERVASYIFEALLLSDYPADRMEIIPIDDRSSDSTFSIIQYYAASNPNIHPLKRTEGRPGKPSALNDAIVGSQGEILLVFDADYVPGKGLLRELVAPFVDPEVGAVMGRVVPLNCGANLLTRLLDLERSAGYQVDQQARHNMHLIPQYGGTVGGFRRSAFRAVGGFDPHVLAEDTELTFRLTLAGWKVIYSNRCECYEEVPENWYFRVRQIRRWAIGHTQCFFLFIFPLLLKRGLSFREKLDGALLLSIYLVAPLLVLALLDSLFLFFVGEISFSAGFLIAVAIVAFNTVGNFASFFEIGTAVLLDGSGRRIRLLPFNFLNFALSTAAVSEALVSHVVGRIFRRRTVWHKTERFRKTTAQGGPA